MYFPEDIQIFTIVPSSVLRACMLHGTTYNSQAKKKRGSFVSDANTRIKKHPAERGIRIRRLSALEPHTRCVSACCSPVTAAAPTHAQKSAEAACASETQWKQTFCLTCAHHAIALVWRRRAENSRFCSVMWIVSSRAHEHTINESNSVKTPLRVCIIRGRSCPPMCVCVNCCRCSCKAAHTYVCVICMHRWYYTMNCTRCIIYICIYSVRYAHRQSRKMTRECFSKRTECFSPSLIFIHDSSL